MLQDGYFSNPDDEEERRARMLQELVGGGVQPQAAAPAAASAAPVEADPEPMQREYRQPDFEALKAPAAPPPDEGKTFDRDTMLAMFLDLATTNGKNVGGIIQGHASALHNRKTEAMRQMHAGTDPEALAIRQRNADLRERELGQRGHRQEFTEQRYDDQGNPLSEHSQGVVKIAGQKAGAGAEARAEVRYGNQDKEVDYRGDIAQEETRRRAAETHAAAPLANQDDAEKARLQSEARVPAEIRVKQTPTQGEIRAQETVESRGAPPPGWHVTSPAAWNAVSRDETAWNKTLHAVGGFDTSQASLANMAKLRELHGAEVWDQNAVGQYNMQMKGAIAGVGELVNAGVIQPSEYQTFKEDLATLKPDGYDLLGHLIEGRDVKLDKLNGVMTGMQQLVTARMKSRGIDRGEAPKNATPAGIGTAPDAGDRLPVTNQKRGQIPKVSALLGDEDEDELRKLGFGVGR